MAGHSKWANIKHRKAAVDKKRGKLWTKIARAIFVAARHGGPSPASNLALRYAIDEARYANMPRDTIERAIKKGSGELGDDYEPVRYEGYGPGGAAFLVDALTNNRTRTATEIRNIFAAHGGNLGPSGCVAYLFESRGEVVLAGPALVEDALLDAALAAGADDVRPLHAPDAPPADRAWAVLTQPAALHAVRDALDAARFPIADARLVMSPTTRVLVRGQAARTLLDLVDALEDNDDVQKVSTNFDIPDDELRALERD